MRRSNKAVVVPSGKCRGCGKVGRWWHVLKSKPDVKLYHHNCNSCNLAFCESKGWTFRVAEEKLGPWIPAKKVVQFSTLVEKVVKATKAKAPSAKVRKLAQTKAAPKVKAAPKADTKRQELITLLHQQAKTQAAIAALLLAA